MTRKDIIQKKAHNRNLRKNFGEAERNGRALLLEKPHKMGTYKDKQNEVEENDNEEDGG
jgi:hypothetical protein